MLKPMMARLWPAGLVGITDVEAWVTITLSTAMGCDLYSRTAAFQPPL